MQVIWKSAAIGCYRADRPCDRTRRSLITLSGWNIVPHWLRSVIKSTCLHQGVYYLLWSCSLLLLTDERLDRSAVLISAAGGRSVRSAVRLDIPGAVVPLRSLTLPINRSSKTSRSRWENLSKSAFTLTPFPLQITVSVNTSERSIWTENETLKIIYLLYIGTSVNIFN